MYTATGHRHARVYAPPTFAKHVAMERTGFQIISVTEMQIMNITVHDIVQIWLPMESKDRKLKKGTSVIELHIVLEARFNTKSSK